MFRRKERPKFTCQRQAAYPHAKFIGTATLMRQRRKKSRIHDDMPAMSIRMTFCKFNGFTNHDAHRDLSNTFAGSQTERFADVITIVDKGLWKQIRETLPQKTFAFRSGIDEPKRGGGRIAGHGSHYGEAKHHGHTTQVRGIEQRAEDEQLPYSTAGFPKLQ